MRSNSLAVAIAIVLSTSAYMADAAAQKKTADYPNKPIRLVVPFAPGGGTDIIARPLAQKLTDALGQSVVIDNRPGGGGTIGTEITASAAPDGYTMVMVSASYSTNAALFKLPYDPVDGITPIALIGDTGFMVGLHPSVAARSIDELIKLAKAKPDALSYGSTGTGGLSHLSTELFSLTAGIKMTHIPYKGTGPALTDLLGGHIQLILGAMPAMVPHHKSGRIHGVGVTMLKRSPAVPELAAVAETLPGYEAIAWYACWGPKGLSKDIVALWNSEIVKAINSTDMRTRMASEGFEPVSGSPEQFRDVLRRDVAKWKKVVSAANVKAVQ